MKRAPQEIRDFIAYQRTAFSHQDADKACGREWVCACAACRIVRAWEKAKAQKQNGR